ncbi:MAG TPA: hypothetical protein VI006_09765 [Solirubrobacteraceae bacterium]
MSGAGALDVALDCNGERGEVGPITTALSAAAAHRIPPALGRTGHAHRH